MLWQGTQFLSFTKKQNKKKTGRIIKNVANVSFCNPLEALLSFNLRCRLLSATLNEQGTMSLSKTEKYQQCWSHFNLIIEEFAQNSSYWSGSFLKRLSAFSSLLGHSAETEPLLRNALTHKHEPQATGAQRLPAALSLCQSDIFSDTCNSATPCWYFQQITCVSGQPVKSSESPSIRYFPMTAESQGVAALLLIPMTDLQFMDHVTYIYIPNHAAYIALQLFFDFLFTQKRDCWDFLVTLRKQSALLETFNRHVKIKLNKLTNCMYLFFRLLGLPHYKPHSQYLQ